MAKSHAARRSHDVGRLEGLPPLWAQDVESLPSSAAADAFRRAQAEIAALRWQVAMLQGAQRDGESLSQEALMLHLRPVRRIVEWQINSPVYRTRRVPREWLIGLAKVIQRFWRFRRGRPSGPRCGVNLAIAGAKTLAAALASGTWATAEFLGLATRNLRGVGCVPRLCMWPGAGRGGGEASERGQCPF